MKQANLATGVDPCAAENSGTRELGVCESEPVDP